MNQPAIKAENFSAFFQELWHKDPFPWQKEFAKRICAGEWPKYVAVPTGSGKTACLDAAVFALAVQSTRPMAERTQGRRIFFIVNRRVIVDEAYERAGELCGALEHASPDSVAGRVANALRGLTGNTEFRPLPLTRAQLRGGIYRDRSWAGSLLQPMIICSTVDQAGSRLLFRGYGVSAQARPIHAALVAHDSLLLVDEAHISVPFVQTLDWVARYREYQPDGCETVRLPFRFVQMTATPPAEATDNEKIALAADDYAHPILQPRLRAAKPARLVIEEKAKGKGKVREEQPANRLTKEANEILSTYHPNSIAIMVNRVATARNVASELEKVHGNRVKLLIGRLRPIDREKVTKEIQRCLKTGEIPSKLEGGSNPVDLIGQVISQNGAKRVEKEAGPYIVVSTQCLEVGADLDFDALVTEAASLDALRQRFGRLNRAGRDIVARAVIVLPADQNLALDKLNEIEPCDSVYGNAIPRAWHWLQGLAQDGVVDFGINAMTAAVESLRASNPDTLSSMLSPTADAPVLLPAYIDCWVQTNPLPAADPDVAIFLHGPKRDMADVQICWRADLPDTDNGGKEEAWAEILSFCPPSTVECLPVPLHVFREWMGSKAKDEFKDLSSEVDELLEESPKKRKDERWDVPALVWRGPDDSSFAMKSDDVRPGDTIVLRVQSGGWKDLGHLPDSPDDPRRSPERKLSLDEIRSVDVGEKGSVLARRRAVLRIHPALWPEPENGTAAAELVKISRDKDRDWTRSEIKGLIERLLDENSGWTFDDSQRSIIDHLKNRQPSGLLIERYPDDAGLVISSSAIMPMVNDENGFDGGDVDADALLEARSSQKLCDHTKDVLDCVGAAVSLLPLPQWQEALLAAAELHDWGKADRRFQALLRSTSPFAAMATGVLLAKSGSIPTSTRARHEARERAALPNGFRHEMVSVQLAETEVGGAMLPSSPLRRDLALHLIATHHGYGRPFAPVVDDETPPEISMAMQEKTVLLTAADRLKRPSHALDSGIAERFWRLTRYYGWWGLALLETVLRLADQEASASPSTPANDDH